jgi:hypothetical protein
MKEVEFEGMPLNIEDVTNAHSVPGWDYLDTQAWEEKNIRNYIHFIDEVIDKEFRQSPVAAPQPIILMGDTKILGYYKQMTSNADRIAGMVEGNYEYANTDELKRRIAPVLEQIDRRDEENALTLLYGAVNTNHYAAGIAEVWRAVAEKKCRLLLVETDYHQAARAGENPYTILIDDEIENVRNRIPDAVDDIIEMTFNGGGDVVFLENGKLEEYQHIACVTYY